MDKAKPDIPEAPGELNLSAFTDLSSPDNAKQLEDAQISRGRLVGPVFLILFVSFSSILGFMWLSSRDLNEEALARDRLVLANLLGAERIQLEASARREAANDELYSQFVESNADPSSRAAAIERLYTHLGDVDGLWVVSKDRHILASGPGQSPGGAGRIDLTNDDLGNLLAVVGSSEGQAMATFVRYEDSIRVAAAAALSRRDGVIDASNKGPPSAYLVMTRQLAPDTLGRTPFRIGFRGLTVNVGPTPARASYLELNGPDGNVIGSLTWAPRRPGDQLLWPLSPAFALGLIAIGYFLFLFVRGADLFMDRQAYLAAALEQEQTIRNLKTRFVSMVSHEIRTPLAAIRAATELLERYSDRMSDKDKAEELSAIHRAVDALSRLVDNVVAMGKSEWLANPETSSNVDLAELCQRIWEEDLRAWDSHRLVINQNGTPRLIRIDVAYLRALLSNLMQNAAKYSPGQPEILVTVNYKPKDIVVQVTDFGIGIPKDEIGSVFEPFRRAKNAESISGSGLGLAISRAAAKALGCKLSLKSKQGEGTTFEVTFPKR